MRVVGHPVRALLALAVALSALAGCSTASAPPPAKTKEPLKIGAVWSTTGFSAVYGVAEANAAKMAAESINAQGGVDGHKIELQVLDDASQPPQAATQARTLVDSGVVAIVAATNVGATQSGIAVAKQAGVVGLLSTGSDTPEEFTDDGIFKILPAQENLSKAVLQASAKDLKAKKVGILTTDDAYGKAQRAGLTKNAAAYGLQIISDEVVATAATDVTPQISKLSKDVDAIILLAMMPMTVTMLKGVQQLGINKPLIGGIGFGGTPSVAGAGNAANGLYAVSVLNVDDPKPNQKGLIDAYRKAYGDPVNFTTAWGWDAVQILAQAARNSGDVTKAGIKAGLQKISGLQGVGGVYTYDAKTHELYDLNSIAIVQFQDGKFKTVR